MFKEARQDLKIEEAYLPEIEAYVKGREFLINGDFRGKDIISIDQFSAQDMAILFRTAKEIQRGFKDNPRSLLDLCPDKVMVPLFFEPSTRTDVSFQTAMLRLGGQISCPSNGIEFSSFAKGENIVDTVRAIGCYADAIVFRHPLKGSSYEAAWALQLLKQKMGIKPSLISGGDGIGEHPTQALLDMFTILEYMENLNYITITMVGDLENGRTVHSLSKAAAIIGGDNIQVNLVSPPSLRMPPQITGRLQEAGIRVHETEDLLPVLSSSNVVYWTRVQGERFDNPAEYEAIKDSFIMTPALLKEMRKDAIFMHPLPRNHEMGTPADHLILDQDPRCIYNEQMRHGMILRMGLLYLTLR